MKLNVSKKILGGFLAVSILLVSISATAVFSLRTIDESYTDLVERRAVIVAKMKDVTNLATEQNNSMRGLLLLNDTESIVNVRSANTNADEILHEALKMMNSKANKEKIEVIIERNQLFKERYQEFLAVRENLTPEEQIAHWKTNIEPVGITIGPLAENMVDIQSKALDEATTANSKQVDAISRTVLILSIITLILALTIGYLINRSISRPLAKITEATQKMASGDLTIEAISVKNKDELGVLADTFNDMTATMRELVQEVSKSTEHVAASSEQLMASAEQTSQATNQIALSIQEVAVGAETQEAGATESSKALQEMMNGMQRMVDATTSVANESEEATKESSAGNESIQKVVSQMDKISFSVDQTATVIQQLDRRSKEISHIIDAITDISDQTNLLALNAAIEAARAGEHGKGFAVVADEVRKLAEQSKSSAEQITKLIHEIQADTTHAVSAMKVGTEDVRTGLSIVKETGEGFERIQHSIELVTEQIQEMSAVSEEMFASLEEVSAAAEEAANISQKTAANTQTAAAASEEQLASMEEITKSSAELAKMSETLLQQVKQFKI